MQNFLINRKFYFKCVSEATVTKVVENLPSDKATTEEIPINMLNSSDFCFSKFSKYINEAFTNKKFPYTLKLFDITPVSKKLYQFVRANTDLSVFYL